MNSRSYDHVPPLASNTVTIATSSTAQVRLQPTGAQLRPMTTVPMRQPVPIRKIVHDSGQSGPSGPSTSTLPQYQMMQQVKEEIVDPMDYQAGASTSSGPLIGPAPSFQQYQRGGPSSSTVTSGALVMSNGGANSMAMDQPAPVNLASKVAEVFLTAGHAFQKLGDLTLQLHTTADADESKWSEKEVDNLKNALTRFAHELDQISTCVASRTTKHIKNDIKRRHIVGDDQPQPTKRLAMNATGPSGTYTTVNSVGMMSGQKRTIGQPMGKIMAARAVIPTARYTVAPMSSTGGPSSSGHHPQSTVVVQQSNQATSGMPQLHSQNPGPSSRLIPTTSGGFQNPTITRVMAPQQMLQGGVKSGGQMPLKRVMTPTSSGSIQSSGALILEQTD
ncbi:Protein CBG05696 [Caenorhabditis briggsae]|uniref:Protein CBG05696 n=2 Tax=Caenorhabditis briggsae TaxID=6238 RepID=A8X0G9_CAEBR|nr:Protein CBG05696 [Caenorhabditis briggsae]ULT92875.1 hypothetical protein L3Y34_010157 [Caenorhabditis briggsae]CAP26129.2 Protein CBG05696 [Caenorhabditis briggsae]